MAVTKSDVVKLASYPAPTYVVGIDDVDEKAYIVSAGSSELRLPSAWESKLARVSEGYTDLPFPLWLFFSMPSDLGYYAWLRRPANELRAGEPALRTEKPTALNRAT